MAEESNAKSPTSNPRVVQISALLAGILTIAILVWIQGVRMGVVKRSAFAKGIDGLAAALAIPVLETSSQRFENRTDRLQKTIESIQRSGQFQSLVVVDGNGVVLATTDTSLKGQTVLEMKDMKSPSKVKEVDSIIEVSAPIIGDGGTAIGALRVRAKL